MISFLPSKFSFSKRRAFFISDNHLTAYFWDGNKLGQSYLFDASSEGLDFFQNYLAEVQEDSVYILLDVTWEEYHLDTIPHVFGADRKAVIKRKQERIFKGAKYFYMDIQSRQKTGRRDDNIMLSAITESSVIQPWLDRMLEQNISIAGIVSLPLLMQEIKEIIPDIKDNNLIFSLQSTSGLRQSFFVGNLLKFSRLVKMPRYDGEVDRYASMITDELIKVQQYIRNTNLIGTNTSPLDIYLLGNHALLQALKPTHSDTAKVRYHFLDSSILARDCGLVDTIGAKHPFSDKYFVHQLLQHKSKNYYATKEEKQYLFMRDMKKSLLLGSVCILLCSVVLSGFNIFDGREHKRRQVETKGRIDFYSKQYDIAQKKTPELPFVAGDLKVAVDVHQALQRYKADPLGMFTMLAKNLDDFPEIKIQQIQWVANIDKDYNFSAGQKWDGVEADKSKLDTDNGGDEKAPLYYDIAIFSGYLQGFDGNYRKGLGRINQFVAALKKSKNTHHVSIIELPMDVDSDVNMKGSTVEKSMQSDFSLRVVVGVRDEV